MFSNPAWYMKLSNVSLPTSNSAEVPVILDDFDRNELLRLITFYFNTQSIDGAQTNPITSLVWLPQNRSLISGCKGGELKVWAGTTKSTKIQFIGIQVNLNLPYM